MLPIQAGPPASGGQCFFWAGAGQPRYSAVARRAIRNAASSSRASPLAGRPRVVRVSDHLADALGGVLLQQHWMHGVSLACQRPAVRPLSCGDRAFARRSRRPSSARRVI
jgi:hypothetical protein